MNRKSGWLKRLCALVLVTCMMFDGATMVFADIAVTAISARYEKHKEKKEFAAKVAAVEQQIVATQHPLDEAESEEVLPTMEVTPTPMEEMEPTSEPEKEIELRLPEVEGAIDEHEEELKALYGEPVKVLEYEKIFQVDATNYVTLLTSTANTYIDDEGKTKEIDLNLVQDVSDEGVIFTPTDSAVDVVLPAKVTENEGILVSKGEYSLELFPESGDYKNATIKDNALLYNSVSENVDAQYTVTEDGVKEDIIVREWMGEHIFSYSFERAGYDAVLKDNQVEVRAKGEEEILFVITAPRMSDAIGEESHGIAVSLSEQDDRFIITLDADETWLSDERRIYPVKIDPTITIPTSKIIEVTTSTYWGVYGGIEYGYIGYITSGMTGVPGAPAPGRTRMYFAVDYNFAENIPSEAKIDSATLNLYQYQKFSDDVRFASYRIKDAWNPSSIDWSSSTSLNLEPSGEDIVKTPKIGMHNFDIRESVNSWVQGLEPNYGLVVMATDELKSGGGFYTPYSVGGAGVGQGDFTPDKRPSITINWSVPDPVDVNFGIDSTTIALRTMIKTSKSGTLQFMGVFADGVAKPASIVTYKLNDESLGFQGIGIASYSYKYPDSSGFDSVFPVGTTKYKDKLGNWQTAIPFTSPAFNTLYCFKANAATLTETGQTNESEKFTVYKVTQFDTLPKIANYYGVPLEQIMYDNRVQDMLLVENNTLFIRNPQKNATVPYTPSTLDDSAKAQIDGLLMGRGLHCEFGFEPINLNTGNFYLNRTDVSIPDYTGDFAIERNYNSKGAAFNSVFGRGWQFAYTEQLSKRENGDLIYRRDDGSILTFDEDNGTYTAPEGYELNLDVRTIKENTYDFGDGEEKYPVYEYSITDANQTVKTFDYFGMLTSIKDEKGNTIELTYDKNRNLKQLKSASGSVYNIKTNEEGNIIEIALPNGAKLKYAYDEKNNLISYTDAVGAITKYEYDDKNQMTAWFDGNGTKMIENTYDNEGRITKQIDGNGGVSTLQYADGQTVTTDANGNATIYDYDAQYRTTQITNPDGTTINKSYNSSNELASETNEMGHTTTYSYDSNGNIASATRFDGVSKSFSYDTKNHLLSETGFDGVTTSYTYDSYGNLTSVTRNGVLQLSYTRDSYGRMLSMTDANGNTSAFQYSGVNLTGVTDAKGGQTSLTYNAHNQIASVTDAKGKTATRSYDAEGRQTGEVFAAGTSRTYTFDNAGYVVGITDGNGYTTSFTYDGLGNQTSINNGEGGIYNYTYDGIGNQLSITDAEGKRTDYTYDARGNIISETDAAGDTITYSYDALGNGLTNTDANGKSLAYTYDYTQGMVNSITDALGDTISYAYAENALLTNINYPSNTTDTYTYDAFGRVTSYTDEGGLKRVYTYDNNGNILSEDVEGRVTTHIYDALNNVTQTTFPDGTSVTYTYDALGNLAKMTDTRGNVTNYNYNSEGQLLSVTDALGNTSAYSYDGNGNESSFIDNAGNSTSISYTGQNQPATITDVLGNTTSYAYNQMEQITQITDALGNNTSYTYNDKGLPETVTDPNGNTYQMTYNKSGNYDTITAPDGTVTTYEYDIAGKVIKETTTAGLETQYEYDARGQVVRTWDNADFDEKYTYDNNGNTLTETNSLGEITQYEYDKYQQLIKTTKPDGTTLKYTYDSIGNLLSSTNEEDKMETYVYDANENIIEVTDHSNRTYTYEYNEINQVVKETDPTGGVTLFEYDVLGNIIKITDAKGNTESFGLDALSQLILHKDKNENTTLLSYDALGRLIKVTTADNADETYTYDANGNMTSMTNGEGNELKTTYDEMNRKIEDLLPTGGIYGYTYDAKGSLKTKIDPYGNEETYETNLYGQMIKKTLPNGAEYTYGYDKIGRIIEQNAPGGRKKTYEYDVSGNLITETDQSNRKVTYDYDVMGRVTAITNPLNLKTSYSYDDNGNLKSQVSPMGRTNTYSYDVMDRVKETLDPSGRKTSLSYDEVGNIIKATVNDTRSTTFEYDNNGNNTSITNALGETSQYAYDGVNQLIEEIDGAGNKTSYTYDKARRMTEVTNAKGGVTTFTYDDSGNLTSLVDGEGRNASYTYDLLDRVIEAAVGIGDSEIRSHYTYDSVGNLTSMTNGNGNKTEFTYDEASNMLSKTNAAGSEENYEYDLNGRLEKLTRPDGSYITYDYNQLDSLLTMDYSKEEEGVVLYAYNQDGQRVSMSDLTGESIYEYDAAGRITGVKQGDGSAILYHYDSFGNLSKLTYSDGSEVGYEYDALDRLIKVTDREGKATTYEYDKAGNMVSVARANNTRATLIYDVNNQVESVTNLDAKGRTISEYKYTYDHSGFILSEEITIDSTKETKAFSYDATGQLTESLTFDANGKVKEHFTYGYDKAGNRTSIMSNSDTIANAIRTINTSSYDEANRLIKSIDENGEVTEYVYDANGNRIREIKAGEEKVDYAYDTENRLLAVTDSQGLLMTALYDGDGNRVFTANRTEDTNEYQLFKVQDKKKSPKTSEQGQEGSLFWYGFGGSFVQAFTVAKDSLGKVWMEVWEDLVAAFHRKVLKDRADNEGIVVNPQGVTNTPGEGDVTFAGDVKEVLIPYSTQKDTYNYYEIRNYVNDVNQEHTQVLSAYDERGKLRESNTYGNERLSLYDGEDMHYYNYTGTGSVSGLTNSAGTVEASYTYDAFGNATLTKGSTYTGNPYTYNAEYVDASTNKQYLRARYYDPRTGSFLTEDSYLGRLLEPLSQNQYTYAENNSINFTDPSGHTINSPLWRGSATKTIISGQKAGKGTISSPLWRGDKTKTAVSSDKAGVSPSSPLWKGPKTKEAANAMRLREEQNEKMRQHLCNTADRAQKDTITNDGAGGFWAGFGDSLKKIFGAGSTVIHRKDENIKWIIPEPWPITWGTGMRTDTVLSSYGDSTKLISVYATGRSDNYLVSSAGVKINISGFTLNISLGGDDIGISAVLKSGDVSSTIGAKVNLSKIKVGFETGATIKTGENQSSTTYANASVNAAVLLAVLRFLQTGEWVPAT